MHGWVRPLLSTIAATTVMLGQFILPYDAVREARDSDALLLGFLQEPMTRRPTWRNGIARSWNAALMGLGASVSPAGKVWYGGPSAPGCGASVGATFAKQRFSRIARETACYRAAVFCRRPSVAERGPFGVSRTHELCVGVSSIGL
jgi:hypothetical protein